jgi:hypothetical protein
MSGPGMYVASMALASISFLEFSSVYLIIWAQVGSLPKNDVDVGTGLVGAPAYVTPSLHTPADIAE